MGWKVSAREREKLELDRASSKLPKRPVLIRCPDGSLVKAREVQMGYARKRPCSRCYRETGLKYKYEATKDVLCLECRARVVSPA